MSYILVCRNCRKCLTVERLLCGQIHETVIDHSTYKFADRHAIRHENKTGHTVDMIKVEWCIRANLVQTIDGILEFDVEKYLSEDWTKHPTVKLRLFEVKN